jgi:hypothetical protein
MHQRVSLLTRLYACLDNKASQCLGVALQVRLKNANDSGKGLCDSDLFLVVTHPPPPPTNCSSA